MKLLKLTQGYCTVLDDADFERAKEFSWFTHRVSEEHIYAAGRPEGKFTHLHRWLMSPGKGCVVDHSNHDTLDNRQENLRVCSWSQNNMNRRASKTNKYLRGVTLIWSRPTCNPWVATIKINRKARHLGCFKTEIEAHAAYLAASKELFGEFVCTK